MPQTKKNYADTACEKRCRYEYADNLLLFDNRHKPLKRIEEEYNKCFAHCKFR